MKKFLKISGWVLLGLIVVILVAAVINRDRLVRLYNVIGLFKQEQIVENFSSMNTMFLSRDLVRASTVEVPWEEDLGELPEEFNLFGDMVSVADFLQNTRTTSLMVVAGDKIFFEQYYLGTGPDDRRISWSVAKSFLSALFGIAVSEGKIASLDDPVTKYVPALNGSAYEGVSIRNVLNMASGVEFDEDYLDFNSDINKMGRVLALGQSMDGFAAAIKGTIAPAGTRHQYVSIDTHVLSMVLRAATGKSLHELFEENLWAKINPQADAYYITDGYGVAFALGGLNITTRDYARFGLLFANDGKWRGQQVIPADWVRASTTSSAPPPANQGTRFGYGYQWWIPTGSTTEFFAVGIYGQFIYVNLAADVVIVKTSAHRGFREPGQSGNGIKRETIELFRAIAATAGAKTLLAGN
ncbi:MAG TPA: class C beta-lactamase-related serine hydrolase [Devosia sp.]|nr:class C beta-lactamase-related serine hydrolase [Devosia sp.]